MRRSDSFLAVLVTVGAAIAGAGLTAPAAAAPHGLPAVSGPVIYGFGSNQNGVFGNGTTTPSLSPAPAIGPPGTVRQLATGLRSAGALLADGTVWTWGNDHYHQLGYPISTDYIPVSTPRQVPGLSGITQIGLSSEGNGYAVGSGGNLWAWGDNLHGQLGNGSTTPSDTPVLVPGISGVTQVAAGPYYVLALKTDGTVWAWGANGGGSLGDGTTTDRLRPERVPGLTGITQVVAEDPSFAVRSDGTLFSWGENDLGQLGNGAKGGITTSPAPVPGLTGVTQVASSGASALAISGSAERVWAWGDNSCSELGDGSTTSRNSPELVSLTGVTQVIMGVGGILVWSSAAIRYDGSLWTWGCNESGQLATGTRTLAIPNPTLVTSLSHVSQFAFGDDSSGVLYPGSYALALGTLPATVPNLGGDTTAQAGQALQAAGLMLGTVSSAVDYTCNNLGTVTYQNPPAGTSVNPGTAVSITIGKAPPPPHQCP